MRHCGFSASLVHSIRFRQRTLFRIRYKASHTPERNETSAGVGSTAWALNRSATRNKGRRDTGRSATPAKRENDAVPLLLEMQMAQQEHAIVLRLRENKKADTPPLTVSQIRKDKLVAELVMANKQKLSASPSQAQFQSKADIDIL